MHNEASSARITLQGKEIDELSIVGEGLFRLNEPSQSWLLSRRVDGEVLPFSMAVYKWLKDEPSGSKEVLKIKDHIFIHNGRFYVIGGRPEGSFPKNHMTGSKYICKMQNFPFAHPDQVDAETKHRLKRHRGVPVGEFSGLGSAGFHIRLADELKAIQLPLAASVYLMYSSM